MAKVRDTAYIQDLVNKREMIPIFESYELQIYRKLEEVDHLLALISSEAVTCGVKADHCREYIRANVTDMIDQIAEKREKEWRKRPKKTK
ncbi:hypothetical protein [Paenibacillus donghaensis]|uniref:Uncharacterized protein n=1 Tax=Paenibacillus donghaensis TaxID=414771 RepID=A0A2Z2KD49_9BACL|nr:hypothetical protein [Paenibacillus donghaensis]ASA20913.1 hypothetical protein B9T62_09025 [Paenibacillus donghaensis]